MEIVRRGRRSLVLMFFVFRAATAYSDDLPQFLVLTPKGEIYNQTMHGMNNEFEQSFSNETMLISEETTKEQIEQKIESLSPRAIILLGNEAIRLYKWYIKDNLEKNGTIPVVALLASQVERATRSLKNVNGIAYETPMVTALINFRAVFDAKVDKVGVVYRDVFKDFVLQHTEYCKREKITVKSILVGDNASTHMKEIKNALKQLVRKEKIDVLWVPNDNRLLKPTLLIKQWIPMFVKHKIPVIVGVESLVNPKLNFGTYAVIPDPVAMGEQAAQIIFDLEESEWTFSNNTFFPAISVYSVVNLKKMKRVSAGTLDLKNVTKVLK